MSIMSYIPHHPSEFRPMRCEPQRFLISLDMSMTLMNIIFPNYSWCAQTTFEMWDCETLNILKMIRSVSLNYFVIILAPLPFFISKPTTQKRSSQLTLPALRTRCLFLWCSRRSGEATKAWEIAPYLEDHPSWQMDSRLVTSIYNQFRPDCLLIYGKFLAISDW